jgi:hypothetical protein
MEVLIARIIYNILILFMVVFMIFLVRFIGELLWSDT